MNCQTGQVGQRGVALSRRWFLQKCGIGVGQLGLASLLAESMAKPSAAGPLPSRSFEPQPPHFPGKAKAVIHLFMAGAPSQLDLFDYKPQLVKFDRRPLPPSIIGNQRYAFIRSDAAVMAPRFKFARHGQYGMEMS